jgi:hypothetical protein
MANDPPFATLNHVAGDLGIPSESALLRIGISFMAWTYEEIEQDWLVGYRIIEGDGGDGPDIASASLT